MIANILVATPQPALGELLRLSLEESSKYRVRLVQSGHEALAAAGRISFDLAILDAALNDQPIQGLLHKLVEPNAGLKLVVIPPENDPTRLSLNGLRPDAYLNLPFYTPDLFELVSSLLKGMATGESAEAPSAQSARPAPFQKNPAEITALLSNLLGQTTAQAGLVVSSRELLASAGRLDPKQYQEITELLNRCWDDQNPSDLARYVRLAETGGEFVVYATSLAAGTSLALVYDPAAPMTRIHGQAVKTAQALRALPNQAAPEPPPAPQPETGQNPAVLAAAPVEAQSIQEAPAPILQPEAAGEELADLFSSPAPSGQEAADLLLALKNHQEGQPTQPAAAAAPAAAEAVKPDQEPDETGEEFDEGTGEEGEMPEVSLSDLLAAMPPPNPGERKLEPGIEWITGDEEDGSAGDFLFPWEKIDPEKETKQPAAEAAQPAAEVEPAASLAAAAPTQPPPAPALPSPATSLAEPPPSEGATEKIIRSAPQAAAAEATRPMNLQGAAPTQRIAALVPGVNPPAPAAPEPRNRVDELETPSGDFASLTYTCVMLPRLPDIKLSGRLVHKLADMLQQICLAYGWRLVNQVIRPDIFQWTVQVSAVVSPGSVVRVVRQQTSQHIFEQFDHFNSILPSGDFWAPGYLIISGSQPPDTRLIGEYIKQTRKRQGIGL